MERQAGPTLAYLVTPSPPQREADIAAYVITIQAPLDDLVTVLTTIYEGRARAFEHIGLEHLIHGTGFYSQCFGPHPTHDCAANYGDLPILLGRPKFHNDML